MGLKKIIDLDLLDRFLTKVKELIPTKTSDLTNDSGYMTGMTILSYGTSTWADFIEAYNNNKVVYCRASSNSNPATGSQTRMAFMAYVNNQTTPTNVEFQYYRSVNQHTDAQQGDQVYVYKLDKNSGWSVTTRNSFSKVVAGTGLSSSYANSTITLTNTLSVPDAATATPVMDGTAAVGVSAKYAKEDHVHPSDTSKADKSSTVSNVSFNSSSSKIQKTINNTTSDVVGIASQSAAGLMSSTDKKKLDGLKPVVFQLLSNSDGSYQDSPTGPFTVWTDVVDILFAYYAVHGNSSESSTFYGYNDVVLYYGDVNYAYGDASCKYEEYELVDAVCTNGENPVVTLTFRTISNNNGKDIVKTVTVTDTPASWDMFEDAIVTYTETPLSGAEGGGGGSSIPYTDAILHVKAPIGSSLTFTKDSTSERLGPEAAHPNADGIYGDWYYSVGSSNYGAWQITAALNNHYDTMTISPSEARQYDVLLRYTMHLFDNGDQCTAITGGWKVLSGGSSSITDAVIRWFRDDAGNSGHRSIVTTNKINPNGRTILKIKFMPTYSYYATDANYRLEFGVSTDNTRNGDVFPSTAHKIAAYGQNDDGNVIIESVDISDYKNTEMYIRLDLYRCAADVYEVWMEW